MQHLIIRAARDHIAHTLGRGDQQFLLLIPLQLEIEIPEYPKQRAQNEHQQQS
jgi:hypothetical protein